MCHACLRRIFTMSVKDPAHMPPKCCTSECIPLNKVDKLFGYKFKVKWNRKYEEYTTKNRIYCPARGCGEWIKPTHIYIDTTGGTNGGRKYGKCSRCKTKVCVTCNQKWHLRRECPKDESTARFAEIAKQEGWQRCFNCSAMVELREGCNHMTCRCRAQFCMICGSKWKSCDCPWFNHAAVDVDGLNHMNVPRAVHAFRGGNPPLAYHDELERRREQERRDEILARRMEALQMDPVRGNYRGDVIVFDDGQPAFLDADFGRHAEHLHGAQRNAATRNIPDRLMARMDATHIAHQFPRVARPLAPSPPTIPRIVEERVDLPTAPQRRASERLVPRRAVVGYTADTAAHHPVRAARRCVCETGSGGGNGAVRRRSTLAGLTRNTTEGRVDEWRRHVDGDDGNTLVV